MALSVARDFAEPRPNLARAREALAGRVYDRLRAYGPTLPAVVRVGLLVLVASCHLGAVWALIRIRPAELDVVEPHALQVRLIAAAVSPIEQQLPPPPLDTPPPAPPLEARLPLPPPDTPPPRPPLEAMVQPPPAADLPPVFRKPAKPPTKAKKPTPPTKAQKPTSQTKAQKPTPPVPPPAPERKTVPTFPSEHPTPPVQQLEPAGHKTVSLGQLAYVEPPKPVYPFYARRAGEWGVVIVRTLIDATGKPTKVSIHASSGHGALDASAVDAVRLARFKPYAEEGDIRPVWVLIPIQFVMSYQR